MSAFQFAKDLVMGNTMSSNGAYYYGRLLATGKTVYNAIASGIKTFSADIALPFVPQNEISTAFDAVIWDNPLIFYTTSYSVTSSAQKRLCRLSPNYMYSPKQIMQYTDEVKRYLLQFDGIQGMADIDKELYVHDFCLNNFKYDYSFGKHAFSILGPVLNRNAVCEGIAKFVKLTLDYLGVKNIIAHGEASDPVHGTSSKHAWNIVKISGHTYHLDVTYDLTLKTTHNRYDYFNLCDVEIKKDHSFANSFPKCVTPNNDYYSLHGMTVNSPSELGTMIGYNLRQGKMTTIAKLKNITDTDNIFNKVMSVAERQFSSMFNRSIMIEVRYNPKQMVFEIEYK